MIQIRANYELIWPSAVDIQCLEYTNRQIIKDNHGYRKDRKYCWSWKNVKNKGLADRSWKVESERRDGGKDERTNDILLQSGVIKIKKWLKIKKFKSN